MEAGFSIGDRVEYRYDGARRGTIVDYQMGSYGVVFDEVYDVFHDLGGQCQYGRGWWCSPGLLTYVDEGCSIDLPPITELFG